MGTKYLLQLKCPNGHNTSTTLLNPTVGEDGTIDGYAGSKADFCDVCDETPEVLGVTTVRCEYFVLCTNDAVGEVDNPVIGKVPTCQRCADRFGVTIEPFD